MSCWFFYTILAPKKEWINICWNGEWMNLIQFEKMLKISRWYCRWWRRHRGFLLKCKKACTCSDPWGLQRGGAEKSPLCPLLLPPGFRKQSAHSQNVLSVFTPFLKRLFIWHELYWQIIFKWSSAAVPCINWPGSHGATIKWLMIGFIK